MKLLSVPELCEVLQIGKNTAYILIHSKGFPKIRIGREWRFEEESLKKWITDRMNSPQCEE